MKRFVQKLVIFLLLLGAGSEIFFRTIIPAREAPTTTFQPTYGLETYDPSATPDGIFSSGRRAQQRSPWHINAQGWNQATDFVVDENRQKPLVAMLGDSYVEGFYIDPSAHVMQRLKARENHRFEVYQLGKSGSGFGHFIQMAHYLADNRYTPDVLVILINRGDFWSSVQRPTQKGPQSLQLAVNDNGETSLSPPKQTQRVTWRRWLRQSALARYLIWNANLNPFGGQIDLAANGQLQSTEAHIAANPRYEQAFRYMTRSIKGHLPHTKIVFLVDADRENFSDDEPPAPLPAMAIIKKVCAVEPCTHVDLTSTFHEYWKRTGQPLNFAHDYHWNETAYGLAAEVLAPTVNDLLPMSPQMSPRP